MSSEISELYEIRDFQEDDTNFILATFLRGLYYGDFFWGEMPKDIFMANYKMFALNLIGSAKVAIKVACLKEDKSIILGYSLLSADFSAIHWVFVKKAWRKQGIARSILPQYPTTVTHLTATGKDLLIKFENKPIFNPFAI